MSSPHCLLALSLLGACAGPVKPPSDHDRDGDGVEDDRDCAPDDPSVSPEAVEVPYDGLDNDCDSATQDDDLDLDGVGVAEDCDDLDPERHPGALELCDGVDQDCDGDIDEDAGESWYPDEDADSWGDEAQGIQSCEPLDDRISQGGDCDDADPAINPAAQEDCDAVDQDCDGLVDDGAGPTWYPDADGDGWGDGEAGEAACEAPERWLGEAGDCDDDDATVYPGAEEICGDGQQNDCEASAAELWEICGWSGELPITEASAALYGPDADGQAGRVVAAAGDVDGDGLRDALIAGPLAEGGGAENGVIWLVRGGTAGERDLSTADAELRGAEAGDLAGWSAAGPGDLDGDGYADLLIGAPGADTAGRSSGAAALMTGPLAGVHPLWEAEATLLGELSGDLAGQSVAGAGDVDGDGRGDVLVGGPGAAGGDAAGRLWLCLGPLADGGLKDADGRWDGGAAETAGQAVAGLGDVDGDGLDDLVVGGPAADHGRGVAWLLLGPALGDGALADADGVWTGPDAADAAGETLAAAGDVDGDGRADLWIGAPGAGGAWLFFGPATGAGDLNDADLALLGEHTGDGAGTGVAGLGDLDGDGRPDAAVGAPWASGGGALSLLLGLETGTRSLADADAVWSGEDSGDGLGYAVAGLGDADGDGVGDLVVGAPYRDGSGPDNGAAWLLYTPAF